MWLEENYDEIISSILTPPLCWVQSLNDTIEYVLRKIAIALRLSFRLAFWVGHGFRVAYIIFATHPTDFHGLGRNLITKNATETDDFKVDFVP